MNAGISELVTTRSLILQIVVWAGLTTMFAVASSAASHEVDCENRSLVGAYVVQLPEFTTSQAPPQTLGFFSPTSMDGRFIFDGDGNLYRSVQLSIGGEITSVTGDGTYVLHHDCSGSISFADTAETFSIFVIDGDSAAIVSATSGESGIGTLQKIRIRDCATNMVQGSYVFYSNGLITFETPPQMADTFLPIAVGGRLTFDGLGTVSRNVLLNFGGSPGPYSDIGTYRVNRDCTGTAYFPSDAETLNLFLIDRNLIAVAVAKSGGVGAGKLAKQRSE
jgi:hypothetical protein